jgi:hypothetical protein
MTDSLTKCGNIPTVGDWFIYKSPYGNYKTYGQILKVDGNLIYSTNNVMYPNYQISIDFAGMRDKKINQILDGECFN